MVQVRYSRVGRLFFAASPPNRNCATSISVGRANGPSSRREDEISRYNGVFAADIRIRGSARTRRAAAPFHRVPLRWISLIPMVREEMPRSPGIAEFQRRKNWEEGGPGTKGGETGGGEMPPSPREVDRRSRDGGSRFLLLL